MSASVLTPMIPPATSTVRAVRAIGLLVLLGLSPSVLAFAQEPHELVSGVIARVLARVQDMTTTSEATPGSVQTVFEEEISPHLDFVTITRWLAGKGWKTLEACDRREMTALIREHIVHVYAALLARGGEADIEIEPASTVRTRSAKVGGRLATGSGDSVDIEFRLLRGEDTWKLYDLSVGGLSFAKSLRAELAPVFNKGGVEALKAYFAEHGRRR